MPQSIRALVDKQVSRWYTERERLKETTGSRGTPGPVIAISRELGSGGAEIAKILANRIDCELIGWSIIDTIAHQSEVRKELVDKMDERTKSRVQQWLDGAIKGQTFDEGDYLHYLLQTIRSFMELGSVVMLGRGACYVPTDRPRVTVRIVAPMNTRVERIMDRERCTKNEAISMIKQSDAERTRFVKRLFDVDWNDPLLYDVQINTAKVPPHCSAAIIETAWLRYVTDLQGPR